MATSGVIHARAGAPAAVVRKIGLEDLKIALRQGFDDYRVERGEMLFLGLIYTVVGLFACLITFQQALLPMTFPLVAGVSIMGPPLASGFYELARRRDAGLDANWKHALDVFRNPPFAAVAILTLFVAALYGLWLLCAWGLYSATMGAAPATSAADFLVRLFTTPQGWTLIVIGNLIGFGFAVVVLTVSVISFPMLVDRRAGPLSAVETSVRAVAANPRTFAVWGLMVAGLLVLGSIPLFVGLAVVLPVLGYATWRLYARVIER